MRTKIRFTAVAISIAFTSAHAKQEVSQLEKFAETISNASFKFIKLAEQNVGHPEWGHMKDADYRATITYLNLIRLSELEQIAALVHEPKASSYVQGKVKERRYMMKFVCEKMLFDIDIYNQHLSHKEFLKELRALKPSVEAACKLASETSAK